MVSCSLCTRRTIITISGVVLVAIGLVLERRHDVIKTLVVSGSNHTLFGPLRQVISSGHKCSPEKRSYLIDSPLPIKINENVSIVDLESSGCFVINKSMLGIWRLIDERNFKDITCGPTEKRFLTSPRNKIRTALQSLPGSGNTWVRYLLEETTGIYTGSIYNNPDLFQAFPGERTKSNVIAIKTHASIPRSQYDKAILIVRDVFDATLAEYNRQHSNSNQTGIPTISAFRANELKSWVNREARNNGYSNNIRTFTGDMFVLFYERLKSDMMNSLTKLAAFCQAEVTLKRLWCAYQNSEGYKHRGKKPEWMSRKTLVDDGMEGSISKWKEAIRIAIDNRKFNCSTN